MNVMLAMFGFGGWEVVLILAALLLFFGAKRLPDLAKSLGSGIKEFKKATREVTEEIQNAASDTPAPKLPPANTTAQSQSQPPQPQSQPQPTPPEKKVI